MATFFRLGGWYTLVAAAMLNVAVTRAGAQTASAHVDHEGEPLPAEAIARIGSGRFRARGEFYHLGYSRDGKTIIGAVNSWQISSGALEFWDAATGKLVRSIAAEADETIALVCDPDGKTLHSHSGGIYRTLDIETGKELKRLDVPHDRHAHAAISPQGKLLVTRQEDGRFGLFALPVGKEVLRLKSQQPDGGVDVTALAFTPDGRTLAIAGREGAIEGFDTSTGAKRFEVPVPISRIEDMHFSPNGRDLFCTAHSLGLVIVRDCVGKPEIVRLQRDGRDEGLVYSAFSPNGRQVAVGSVESYVTLYDVATGKPIRRLPAGWCSSHVAFSRDGHTLLAGNRGGAISQWDTDSGKLLAASANPLSMVQVKRFVEGSKHLLVETDCLELMDWKKSRVAHRYALPAPYADQGSQLSADGTLLATYRSNLVILLDAKSGKEVRRLGSEKSPVYFEQFLPVGNRFLTLNENEMLRVWEGAGNAPVHELRTPHWPDMRAASLDGRRLATGCGAKYRGDSDHDVRIWDLATGKLVQRLTPRGGGASALALSDDGSQLAVATASETQGAPIAVSLVDVPTGREKRLVATYQHDIHCLQFSPDGRTLAVTDRASGHVRLWEVATGKQRHQFEGHKTSVYSLAFSGDGALLATGSLEAPAFVWDIWGKHAGKPASESAWSGPERQRVWQDLASADARVGFSAVRRLVQNSTSAADLLQGHLHAAKPADPKKVAQWLKELDSDEFETRQNAFSELEKLGGQVEANLKDILARPRSLEMKRRAESLLTRLDSPTAEGVRELRAAEALEHTATPRATRLLESMAAGAPGALLTREAASALARLGKR